MTDEEIKNLLDQLNSNKFQGVIFERPLSPTVVYAAVIIESPIMSKNSCNRNFKVTRIYFVKGESGKFVSAVVVMRHLNLHWFTLPNHRKNGYLKRALKQFILPDLGETNTEQRITIDKKLEHYEASSALATSLGFVSTEKGVNGSDELKCDLVEFGSSPSIAPSMSEERFQEIKSEIDCVITKLGLLSVEIEISLNTEELFDEFQYLELSIKDIRNNLKAIYEGE